MSNPVACHRGWSQSWEGRKWLTSRGGARATQAVVENRCRDRGKAWLRGCLSSHESNRIQPGELRCALAEERLLETRRDDQRTFCTREKDFTLVRTYNR
jgi:hypothetical protein